MKGYLLNLFLTTIKVILAVLVIFCAIWLTVFIMLPDNILDFSLAKTSENEELYVEINPFEWEIQLTNTQKLKSDLTWSPNNKYLAYFENVMEPSPNPNRPFDREWALKIIYPRTLQIKTILIGDSDTSNYEWINDKTIRIYISAGTGVRAYHDLSINQKEPWIIVDHASPEYWTPILSI